MILFLKCNFILKLCWDNRREKQKAALLEQTRRDAARSSAIETENETIGKRRKRSSLSHLETLNSRRGTREKRTGWLGVIPRSGGAWHPWEQASAWSENGGGNKESDLRSKAKSRDTKRGTGARPRREHKGVRRGWRAWGRGGEGVGKGAIWLSAR
jgi:hypothetical protein